MKSLAELKWQSRFVERLPGDPVRENYIRQVRGIAYSEVQPTPVQTPLLLGWSTRLAEELGIRRPEGENGLSLNLLAGNSVLAGMRPYAARYGGHQFGHWAGQLGDGRAITLGEAQTPAGRMEFQLKGAGPTPYSRRADGRAVMRSSVREFLCSEAMHFLGIPTTRALSLVSTGDPVVRDMFYDGNPKAEPGAIVCRVAPSFLRFGNFQIVAAQEEPELLKKLTDLLIQDHYPQLDLSDSDVYGKLLDEISRRTAVMVAHWMRVGFVHGVMNTDNMSALGLTIDYGPYGWLEPFDPQWTPNTTDAEGRRYRHGGQPGIALWNLARLAEAWLGLVGGEARAQQSLTIYQETFEGTYGRMISDKLGIPSLKDEKDQKLVEEVFQLLYSAETDYTIFFRALCSYDAADGSEAAFLDLIAPAFYAENQVSGELRARWMGWAKSYAERIRSCGIANEDRWARMRSANPKYVLRNYLAQNAIDLAEKGDPSGIERLLRVLERPYDDQPGEEELAQRRPEWARNKPGCSALSCSS